MKYQDLFKKDVKGLQSQKTELQQELMTINAQIATKTTLQSPGRKKSIKKTIARINTLLHQRDGIEEEKPKEDDQKKENK
jgi:ribosomal protein L29